jgi:imidazolonepropionase
LVFAASREEEFVDKIKGMSYEEIAAKGGGILNSAKKLNAMSEDELFDVSVKRLNEVIKLGTGAIEIKSGYGLSVEGELKMLTCDQKIKRSVTDPDQGDFSWSSHLSIRISRGSQGLYRYYHQ